tara:strand:- start:33 stop:536 length:504 start_codon:yes stop_codon:yes gene_type:complete
MAVSNLFVNIKNLPQSNAINSGDYLIVETPNGTQILDFADFIITSANTTFSSVLSSDSTSYTDSRIASLSATVNTEFDKIYYGKGTVNVQNATTATVVLTPTPSVDVASSITTTDVIITPSNAAAAAANAYISAVSRAASNAITVTIGVSAVSSVLRTYNVLVMKPY